MNGNVAEKRQICTEERSALVLVGDRFARIEAIFDEVEVILNTHLDRYVGLLECFQRGLMEVENIREEIKEQLHKFSTPEEEE